MDGNKHLVQKTSGRIVLRSRVIFVAPVYSVGMVLSSKLLVGVALAAFLLGIIATVSFQTFIQTPSSPQQVTSQQPAPKPVKQQETSLPTSEGLRQRVESYFEAWVARDYSKVLSFYFNSSDTIVEWTGKAGGYVGSYRIFATKPQVKYAEIASRTDTKPMPPASPIASLIDIRFNLSNYKADLEGNKATVTLRLNATGHAQRVGAFGMNVDATMTWKYVDKQWIIVGDRWNFTHAKHEYESEIILPGASNWQTLPYWP